MDDYVKQTLSLILHKKMQAKAELERLRFLEQTDRNKSYKKEIDTWLDRLNELNELYEKIKNQ